MFNLYRKKLYVSKININKYITRSFQNASVIKKEKSDEVDLTYEFLESTDKEVTKPMVWLHGLFGNRRNWGFIAKNNYIMSKRRSILFDLRNHGESDHHRSHTYKELADDVVRNLDKLKIDKFTLLGHSMGAKTAMGIALNYPDRLDGLIIIDSAPIDMWDQPLSYQVVKDVLDKIHKLDIEGKTRQEVSKILRLVFTPQIANLLATNLVNIDDTDKVKWRVNINATFNHFRDIIGFDLEGKYHGPIMVLLGAMSQPHTKDVFSPYFPNIEDKDLVKISQAGHWVHSDQPNATIKEISRFLEILDNMPNH